MILSDVYVFFNSINSFEIDNFFRFYLTDFVSSDDFFEYPKYGTPVTFETESYEEMLKYVIENNKDYTFYFDSENENLNYNQSILRINNDNSMLLGLLVMPDREEDVIKSLKERFNTEDVFVTYSIPPLTSRKAILKALSDDSQ
jgi:hypothetical protein